MFFAVNMYCKMQIKLPLSFICFVVLLYKVQAKAVERSKHVSYTGPYDSSSIHIDTPVFPISGKTDFKSSSNIAPSKIGKPLYFGHDSMQTSYPLKGENYESPSTDRYELPNYGNLESFLGTKLEFLETPTLRRTQRKIDHAKVETKSYKDGDVFGEDQVFMHKNKIKSIKPTDNERAVVNSSKLPKPTDVGPPCDKSNLDYKNKTTDELLTNINVHGMMYGNQNEPNSQGKIHEPISEDFHQYETKIIHKNVDSDEAKLPNIIEKAESTFEEHPESTWEKTDRIEREKKLTPLESADKELKDINQLSGTNIPIKLNPPNVDSEEAVDTLIKSKGNKQFKKINPNPVPNFRSFVFNPNAQPQEVFQECVTPKNESGNCRYIQHCMLPSILSSIRHFMDNVCIIKDQFIGVCCPEFPVHSVLVNWPDTTDDFNSNDDTVEVPEDCGIGANRRIVGGLNADRKAWPWMVALLNNQKKFFCGGSLINNRYVLTAAHCTFGPSRDQIIARLGEYDFNDPREPHDDYSVIEIKRHGQYARFTLRNDIAVLKLDRPVVFNEFVKTICLPDPEKDYLGKSATLAGWGHLNGDSSSKRSSVLQEASFPIIGNDECGKTHGIPIATSIICAAAQSKDKGACNGDSGGPLMVLDSDERWKVIGIVSWGRRGCNPKFPTAYSRVTHYLDWIKGHTT